MGYTSLPSNSKMDTNLKTVLPAFVCFKKVYFKWQILKTMERGNWMLGKRKVRSSSTGNVCFCEATLEKRHNGSYSWSPVHS
jgi:hypothetical protein